MKSDQHHKVSAKPLQLLAFLEGIVNRNTLEKRQQSQYTWMGLVGIGLSLSLPFLVPNSILTGPFFGVLTLLAIGSLALFYLASKAVTDSRDALKIETAIRCIRELSAEIVQDSSLKLCLDLRDHNDSEFDSNNFDYELTGEGTKSRRSQEWFRIEGTFSGGSTFILKVQREAERRKFSQTVGNGERKHTVRYFQERRREKIRLRLQLTPDVLVAPHAQTDLPGYLGDAPQYLTPKIWSVKGNVVTVELELPQEDVRGKQGRPTLGHPEENLSSEVLSSLFWVYRGLLPRIPPP
jgi:hypothetical protein